MYFKRKGGLAQGRPTRFGNAVFGINTDLTDYGYYTVTNNPPPPPSANERYVDDNTGTYDEVAKTYTANWVLFQQEPPTLPSIQEFQFLELLEANNGESNVLAARNDPALEFFWLIYNGSEEISLTKNIEDGLDIMEANGHITSKQDVLDLWLTI